MNVNTMRANYRALDLIAKQFANGSDSTEIVLNMLRTQVDDLRGGGWLGEAADDFYTEMEDVIFPTFVRLINGLRAVGDATNKVITTIQQGDEEASGLFGI